MDTFERIIKEIQQTTDELKQSNDAADQKERERHEREYQEEQEAVERAKLERTMKDCLNVGMRYPRVVRDYGNDRISVYVGDRKVT